MEEKRRHQRYGCNERKFVARYNNADKAIGEVNNFSRSGISFDSKDNLEKEVKLDLEINGLEQKLPASVEIVWSKKTADSNTYGAKFTSISPESKFYVLDLLYQDWRKNLTPTLS
ncbi:MAG: PilZ domain-containing protein [Candidatus Omnitrophota bacterium]